MTDDGRVHDFVITPATLLRFIDELRAVGQRTVMKINTIWPKLDIAEADYHQ